MSAAAIASLIPTLAPIAVQLAEKLFGPKTGGQKLPAAVSAVVAQLPAPHNTDPAPSIIQAVVQAVGVEVDKQKASGELPPSSRLSPPQGGSGVPTSITFPRFIFNLGFSGHITHEIVNGSVISVSIDMPLTTN